MIKKKKQFNSNILKKKKRKKQSNILFNILLKSKNIYGNYLKDTKKEVIPFIYGIRYKKNIINLNITSLYLKRSFFFFKYLKKKNILIIGNAFDINFLLNKNFIKNKKNIYFLNKEWVYGLITNKKKLFFLKKKFQLIFILKTSINDFFFNNEISLLNIPIISFKETQQQINNINYPIISNLKNIKSIYTLMYLFRKNIK